MNEANEQVVRTFLKAFGDRDMDAVRAQFTDDAVFHISGNSPMAGEHTGVDDVLATFGKFRELTDDTWQAEMHDLLSTDEHVVALFIRTGTRGGSQGRFPAAVVYHIQGGKIADMWVHEQDLYAFDAFFA